MLNEVILIGRLTRDPDLKYTQSGVAVTNFTLAVNRRFTNQQGEREADFINIVAWRKTAENCAEHLRKGSLAAVTGSIETGSYEKEGRTVYTTHVNARNVQFLDRRGGNSGAGKTDPFADDGQPIDIKDEDLPF
ncbi:single-stranded DNA-binding protein [Paenactinomyces guangxiensis]|uniref:Single-stranded DNA-binding protein n=1 Tax=Paenactinomyces guangxiensis TaxID=1490290 RepID=A0A7W1WSC6_9BACL|nr:single-stranded DNA-binding protein [Paenactinomyces guangxiensis]MBA4495127.1 single-stranded DNA-binding protein [Paenactinomyces guangxiensis]MBH8592189.1 single-stranded DNA-binding protein [Paenactinomyces guangxiensis]